MIDNRYVAYNSLVGFYQYNSAGQVTLEEPVSAVATNSILNKEQYKLYYEATSAIGRTPTSSMTDGITVYPSPATSLVALSLSNGWHGAVAGVLIDMAGKVWRQWSETVFSNFLCKISVAELPTGVYYLTLSNRKQTSSKMMIVQH